MSPLWTSGSVPGVMMRTDVEVMRMTILSVLVLIIFGVVQGSATGDQSLYSISTPPFYVVFSGDLDLNYFIPGNVSLPHAFVKLDVPGKGEQQDLVITTMGLQLGRKTGNLKVKCGVIEFAGTYRLRMYSRVNGRILTEVSLDVRWPEVGMSLPLEQEAQKSPAELHVVSNANCSSLLRRYSLHIKMLFKRVAASGENLAIDDSAVEVIDVRNFTAITKVFSVIIYGCHFFDLDGYYQAVMVSTAPQSPDIARSNVMHISWSGDYRLTMHTESIFPCPGHITLIYSHPPCSGRDKIRLYSLFSTSEGSSSAPLSRQYVAENHADPDHSTMRFQCSLFNQSATGFCFVYMSVTRGNVYSEQRQLCLPAQADAVFPIDGSWSQWTEWSPCSVTCGIGKKSRYRLCNDPPPKDGGFDCQGERRQNITCTEHCPDFIPRTPLHSPNFDTTTCDYCGCKMEAEEGEIIATGRCHGLAVWFITAPDAHVITLHFDYYHLNYTRQWVKVRDGHEPSDDLLFFSVNRGVPLRVTSSGPRMRVELMTSYLSPPPNAVFPKAATLPIHTHGFIASYKVTASIASSTASVLLQYEEKSVFDSTITIVGIAICAAVILVAVIFVVLQRTVLKRHGATNYRMGASESPAHATPDRQGSSCPSSTSSPGLHDDMETPLTGKMARKHLNKDKRKPSGSSRTPSLSSKGSHRRHGAYSGAEGVAHTVQPGGGHRSHRSGRSNRTHGNVVSETHGIEIIDMDERGGAEAVKMPSILKTSKGKSANSTHPSRGPKAPGSKIEMLNRKRQEKREGKGSGKDHVQKGQVQTTATGATADFEREVTGSSGSSKSGAASTTKAEVNWPQSGATGFMRAALNEMGKTFSSDRSKSSNKTGQRPPSEEIPLIESYSSQESPSHAVNTMVKSDSIESTSFMRSKPSQGKVRRPTSITEAYSPPKAMPEEEGDESSNVAQPIPSLPHSNINAPSSSTTPTAIITPTTSRTLTRRESAVSDHNAATPGSVTPVQLPPPPQQPSTSTSIPPTSSSTSSKPTTAFSLSSSLVRPRPPKVSVPQKTPTSTSAGKSINGNVTNTDTKNSAFEERQNLLPKPDGQSPKLPRHEMGKEPSNKKTSLSHPSSSSDLQSQRSSGSKSNLGVRRNGSSKDVKSASDNNGTASPSKVSQSDVSSPTRSIPSEIEGLELEYDDFIEDDPLSYFDYEETQKLAFRGVEKIGQKPVDEEDEEETGTNV